MNSYEEMFLDDGQYINNDDTRFFNFCESLSEQRNFLNKNRGSDSTNYFREWDYILCRHSSFYLEGSTVPRERHGLVELYLLDL